MKETLHIKITYKGLNCSKSLIFMCKNKAPCKFSFVFETQSLNKNQDKIFANTLFQLLHEI